MDDTTIGEGVGCCPWMVTRLGAVTPPASFFTLIIAPGYVPVKWNVTSQNSIQLPINLQCSNYKQTVTYSMLSKNNVCKLFYTQVILRNPQHELRCNQCLRKTDLDPSSAFQQWDIFQVKHDV